MQLFIVRAIMLVIQADSPVAPKIGAACTPLRKGNLVSFCDLRDERRGYTNHASQLLSMCSASSVGRRAGPSWLGRMRTLEKEETAIDPNPSPTHADEVARMLDLIPTPYTRTTAWNPQTIVHWRKIVLHPAHKTFFRMLLFEGFRRRKYHRKQWKS